MVQLGDKYLALLCILQLFNAARASHHSHHDHRKHQKKASGEHGHGRGALRIVNGETAKQGELPYQVVVFRNAKVHCGGVLISNQWALTAGHCIYQVEKKELYWGVGKTVQQAVEPNEVYGPVSDYIIHPEYSYRTLENDIALLKLDKAVTFGPTIQTIKMAPSDYKTVGGSGLVSGFGTAYPSVASALHLQKLEVPIVDHARCKEIHRREWNRTIFDNHICAGELKPRYDNACYGDSGGPLVRRSGGAFNNSTWILIGLVSFNFPGCTRGDIPEVFVEVAKFRRWISEKTGLPAT